MSVTRECKMDTPKRRGRSSSRDYKQWESTSCLSDTAALLLPLSVVQLFLVLRRPMQDLLPPSQCLGLYRSWKLCWSGQACGPSLTRLCCRGVDLKMEKEAAVSRGHRRDGCQFCMGWRSFRGQGLDPLLLWVLPWWGAVGVIACMGF